MNIAQLLHTAFRSILRNRMRSLLTSLGVIIGVGSVIVMVALGEGSQRAIEARIAGMGVNLLQIMPRPVIIGEGAGGGARRARLNRITTADLRKLKAEASFAAAISGVVQGNFNAVGSAGAAQVNVQGVEPGYLIARGWKTAAGAFFDETDLTARNRVAVLGQTTAKNLFGGADEALERQVRIGTVYFTVIGVLETKGAGMNGSDQDDVIIAPLDTVLTRLSGSGGGTMITIMMSVAGKEYMDAAQKEAELILRESRKIADGAPSDFNIMNQAEMIDMASATSRTLTALLAAIAGVSLLVGGIGIMNIMLVSVTERTREIGIRMAVGGRRRDILFQFLAESVILSLSGGFIGIAAAFAACGILSMTGMPAAINPAIVAAAALFAALVGVFFGFYPARKAAGLYPIDALRYE